MSTPGPRRRLALAVQGAVAAAAFALAFTRITSPDLGFHLATGRAVLALGRIPATNVLSFTEPDHPWILHEWLPAVLFELAWQRFGPAGVLAVKVAVVVATWVTVHAAARRLGASPLAAGVATLLGAGAAATRFSERPQIFSALGLAVCALLLAHAGAATGPRRVRFAALAGLAGALGVQVHAGAVTSFALMLAVAAGLAIEPLRSRLAGDEIRAPSGLGAAGRLAGVVAGSVGLAALLLVLYHPHGARPLLVPFQLGSDPDLREHVVEYRSSLAFPFRDLHLYWLFAGVAALAVGARARRLPASLLVPFVGFAALSLRYVRTADAFAIVAAPVLAVSLAGLAGARLEDPRALVWGLVVTALLAVGLPIDHWRAYPPGAGIAESVWPTAMFRFIEDQHLSGPAFVSDGWAGPYLGVFYPRERAFFDPRFEAYSPAFVRDVYRSIRYGEAGAEEKLEHYGVDVVLLKYTMPRERELQGGGENLRQILAKSPAWALVGFGDTGELFVRRSGAHAAVAASLAIPGVDPDRGAFLGRPAQAALPLVQAIDRGFHDNRILALAAAAVADAGNRGLAEALLARADAQHPGDPQVLDVRRLLGP
jgi:hypothetical protein